MKKGWIITLWVIGILTSCARDGIRIEGTLTGVPDSTVMVLFKLEGNVGSTIGKDTLMNGRFEFELKEETGELCRYQLMAEDFNRFPPMGLNVWARPGDVIRVEGSDPLIYTWKVEGESPEQRTQQRFIEASRSEWEEIQRILLQIEPLNEEANRLEGEAREKMIVRIDSMEKRRNALEDKVNVNNIRLMKEEEVNEAWLEELYGLAMSIKYDPEFADHKDEVQALYDGLDERWKRSGRDRTRKTIWTWGSSA